jgi:two-component system, cell cycle sensor histidine kinase and response regulator CckA
MPMRAMPFRPMKSGLLTELADDLAYGICSLRAASAKKLAEEAFHANQIRLQFLLSHTPAIIYSLRTAPKLEVSFISSNVEKILGHPPDKFIQNADFWFECLHPEDRAKAEQVFQVSIGSGMVSREYRFRHADGNYRWMRDEMRVVNTRDGRPDELVGHWFDITEQKLAEELRRKSEVQFESLFSRHSACKLIIDPATGIIRNANEAAVKFYGWPLEKLKQMRIQNICTTTAGEGEKRPAENLKLGGVRFESRHRLADGSERDVEVFSTAIETDGEILLYSINIDITDRKQAESRLHREQAALRGILNATLESVWLFDVDCRILMANKIAARRFGKTVMEMVGRHYSEFLAPELAQSRIARLKEAIRLNQPLEFEDIRGENTYRNSLYPVSEPDGKVTGVVCYSRDITEQQKTQAALLKREEIFSNIVNQAGDAIGLVDVETMRFVEFNEAAHAMLGYTREEFTGFGPADIDAQFTPEEIRQKINLIVKQGSAVFETKHRHRNGELRDFRINARRILLQGKNYITAIWSDITEGKRKEIDLRKLSLAVEQNPSSIVITDPRGNIEYVNHRFTEVTGYTLDEVRGQNPRIFKSGQQMAAVYEELWREITAGRDWRGELINRKKDGSFHTELVVIAPVKNTEGVITHFVAMKEDITERKRIEENHRRLATAVEQSGETIVITDTGGTILYANPAFEKSTGYSRAEAIGKNPRLLKSGKQEARFYREMWDRLARGETWKGHFINQRKDGTLYEEDATISTIRDAHGKIVNYVAAKRDVTREMQLEAQFRQAQKMEAMGTLAGGIAHDFNNILTVIFGYGYMLQMATTKNKDLHDKVAEILLAAKRAKELVQQILTFSRQHEQKREIIRLGPVIKEATKFLRASLPANIQIDMELAEKAPAVLADPTQIYQVVMNLATNALHAMEGQQGRLTIKLEAFVPNETFLANHPKFRSIPYTRLTIADTGHGMDAKTMERIFEPFFTTKPVGKGTGLGLAVVHGIIQSHDGAITVESQIGRGTTFGLFFPAQTADQMETDVAAGQLPLGNGQKIMVVDDEIPVGAMLQKLLTTLNYQAAVCHRPDEAIALIKKIPGNMI